MTRLSLCDNCQRAKTGCQWVTRSDSGAQYFVCPSCREYWERLGKLRELDVEAGDPVTVRK